MDIFCKIVNKELPAKVIYEDEIVMAFEDINPISPGHFLVIPKTHSTNLIDIEEENYKYLFDITRKLALDKIKELGVEGFKININNGKDSGQEVFHTHIHIVPSAKTKF